MNLRLRKTRARGGDMSVVEHLEELRYRLIVIVVAVVVGSVIAYVFYEPILDLLLQPLDEGGRIGDVEVIGPEGVNVFVGGIATAFVLRMKVAAFAGIILALPIVMFQLWRFITPGLNPREKRFSVPFVLSALLLFGVGAWVAFAVLPVGIEFLLGFVPPAKPLIQLSEYLNFVIFTVLGFGLTFQFPLVLVFLGMAGILPSSALRKRRRLAVVLAFVVSAVATPSGDPITQTAMAVPLYILYETSIIVIRYGLKR